MHTKMDSQVALRDFQGHHVEIGQCRAGGIVELSPSSIVHTCRRFQNLLFEKKLILTITLYITSLWQFTYRWVQQGLKPEVDTYILIKLILIIKKFSYWEFWLTSFFCERYFFQVCLVIDKYCHSCRLFLENDLFPHSTSNAIKVGAKENFNPS